MEKTEDSEDYFDLVQEELLLKRKQLQKLIKQSTILGNYYEELVKDILVRSIPKKYSIATGVISGPKGNSNQLDIIIYDNTVSFPLFSANNLIILRPDYAKLIIEVKSEITTDTMKSAIKILRSAIDVFNSYQVPDSPFQGKLETMIVGFSSDLSLIKIKEQCKSQGIGGIFVLSKRNGIQINGQFSELIQSILYTLEYGQRGLHFKELLERDHYIQKDLT
jgi:hypothetical protein